MILCDIGNSSFHFFDTDKSIDFKVFDENLPVFEQTPIYFISVNAVKTALFLKHHPTAINLEPFVSLDTQYKGMGIDRQVICYQKSNCIIVDAGSAITVDILDTCHQGGFILPGIGAYLQCYAKISPKLIVQFEKNTNLAKIPSCTQEAINYAILQSIILPIREVCGTQTIYFSGGDGEFLASFFENGIYNKNMIFDAMIQIIKDKNVDNSFT